MFQSLRSSLRLTSRPPLKRPNRLSESGGPFTGIEFVGNVPGQLEEIEQPNFQNHRILVTGPSPLNPPLDDGMGEGGTPSSILSLPPINPANFKKSSKGGPLKPNVLADVNNSV